MKPRLCVLTAEEEACYDEMEIRWQAAQPLSLCLYKDTLDIPLKCWEQVQQGTHHFVLSASRNVTFHLREPGSGSSVMVSEAFEVIQDHQRYRRQRRNPWSFF